MVLKLEIISTNTIGLSMKGGNRAGSLQVRFHKKNAPAFVILIPGENLPKRILIPANAY